MLALLAAVTLAATTPTAAQLQAGLAGRWTGALGYRDYQTNKLEEIPVATEFRTVGDGVTLIGVSTYDDGPRVGSVYITSVQLFAGDSATTATSRKGRAMELATDKVAVTRYVDATHWTIVASRDGTDDDNPAKLRTTETRDGDSLLSIKEVLPASATDGKYVYRNQRRLTRVR
ncbi:hypothetical protein [Glacieibacterium frigidum]|uniref:Lipocalin-like domain-containing protein n=1 Tax=Glacieibacterium frigidum TaxID=2593303 RepID=A0A552UA65_9SPHN|nr:hypothetical protein [Glacieibacterium frigidum]TRW15103.1 hypothetical protein FMM06_15775 [Glacieibacterium frigidum]